MSKDVISMEFYTHKNLRADDTILKVLNTILELGPPFIPKKYHLGKATKNRYKKFRYEDAIEKLKEVIGSYEDIVYAFNTFSDEDGYDLEVHISLRSFDGVNRYGRKASPNVVSVKLDAKFFEPEEFCTKYLELAKKTYDLISPVYGSIHTRNDTCAIYDPEKWLRGGIYGSAGFYMVYWANFLSPEGVSLKGGWERIKTAPAYQVERLSDGGALILLDSSPLNPESEKFRGKQNALLSFFGLPVINEEYFERIKDRYNRLGPTPKEEQAVTAKIETKDVPYVYDKAKYHHDGNFPEGLNDEQAYVHTGLFLGWLIDNSLYSESFQKDHSPEIESFKKREKTGPRVYESVGGALVDDMLSDQGNRFSRYYFKFDSEGEFINDYMELLVGNLPSIYHVKDTWENYDKIKKRFDQRFAEWKRNIDKTH